jgi:tetratricopeptide (TPR) repeat protein
VPEAGGGARLSELEARWRTDRSPRVFLQLADELRRAGANERAVRILQEGLTHHPDSVSGRVALGRLQLEQGDAPGAAETLERALARDPAQIVASKLLIEAWIRMGDATRARERLDLYRILQQRDAEIDEYERKIAAMERAERQAALDSVRSASPEEGAAAAHDATTAASSGRLFDLGVAAPLPPVELTSSLGLAGYAAADGRAARTSTASASMVAIDAAMPFGAIHDPAASAARIYDFFRGEALFVLPPTIAARAARPLEVAASSRAVDTEAAAAVAMVDVAPALEATDGVDLFAVESTAEAVAAETEPRPIIAFEQFSTLTFADEVERDTLEEPLADVLAEAGVDASTAPPADHARAAAGAATPAAATAAGPPSATLARLYLDQGHFAEAEAEFRRVLAERPEDDAALQGLEEVRRRRAADETVSGWAAGVLSAPRPPRAVGLTQRKIETLRDYLARIRRGQSRAHVS